MDTRGQARREAKVREQGEVTVAVESIGSERAAVFVDYENVKNCGGRTLLPDEVIAAVRSDLARFMAPSFINVYLAVGLPESQAPVSNGLMYRVFKAGGTAVLCPSFRNGTLSPKNLADPTAIIDIGESIFAHPEIRHYVLATGDKDFIPAVRKLRKYGKHVRLYHGDSVSSHLRDEISLDRQIQCPPEEETDFSSTVSLTHLVEQVICHASSLARSGD